MNIEKQKLVLSCFTSGKYRAMLDRVYYKERGTGTWKPIVGNKLKDNYTQIMLTPPAKYGEGRPITVYKHVAIYIANKGMCKETDQVDHLDRNNQNDLPDNLEAKTPAANIKNSKRILYCNTTKISDLEIEKIKELMKLNLSQSEIARRLNRKRLTVRRYMILFKKI